MESKTKSGKNERNEKFVSYIIELYKNNTKAAATLKKADNDNLSYKAWEYLVNFHIDIENEKERTIYSLIAANIVKNKVKADGKYSIGLALRNCYDDEDQGKSKLMRLLACNHYKDLCIILHYLLPFIEEKAPGLLSYSTLISDIFFFNENKKAKWANDFFKKINQENENDTDTN